MPPQDPWRRPTPCGTEKVGLFSVGSFEEKLPLVLSPLLFSSDLILSNYKNFAYPRGLSVELITEIKNQLQKTNIKIIVFDLRIHGWINTPTLRRSRILSKSLQDLCDGLQISNSIILSNGDNLIGKAVGVFSENMEAKEVLRGKGPPDLTKFALEIGADFLMMTEKAHQRIEAKKWLRDKIIKGELHSSQPYFAEITTISSHKKGYVHHFVLDKLHALRAFLSSTHPGIGFFLTKKPGDWVAKGDAIVDVYHPKGQKNPLRQEACQKIFKLSADPPNHQPLILERLGLNLHS
ncbi:MAG: hypothetical protein JSV17_10080 [Candidatus Aminicenantes bacterium]|nr:MAG: hypothetical protein JSV17_10080 [Candidatus Aminicenantes bacterium]